MIPSRTEESQVPTFVLIHGAGTDSWYWEPLGRELERRGFTVVAPDLPVSEQVAGLSEYADAVVDAIGTRSNLIVVAHSFGGFVGPIVCSRVPARLLVLLHAQIPKPGETPGDWWEASGYQAMRADHDSRAGSPDPSDPVAFALHDSPLELVEEYLREHQRDQAGTPFGEPWPLDAWPDTPTRVLIAEDDHFFPVAFMRELSLVRLGIEADTLPGDHAPMIGHPHTVADRLERYLGELAPPVL